MNKILVNRLLATSLLIGTTLFSSLSFAKSPIYTGYFSNVALSGYDAVAYFTVNKPVKGSTNYSTEYNGADWHFTSQTNLDQFKAMPDKYAPQYGGYCAWAVANNDTAKGDPLQWNIHEGKLYLNYNAEIRQKWSSDKSALILKADNNWPKVIN